MTDTGQDLSIHTADGTAEAYLSGVGTGPGVLMFMDAIGLRPQLRAMADRIAGWGYTVLVPNVFHRLGTVAELAPTADLRDPDNRAEFGRVTAPRVQEYTAELSDPDTRTWLQTLEAVAPGDVGVVGFCMGARLAMRAAALDPRVRAVAAFHGARLVSDDAESPHLLLDRTRAEYVFGHADGDALNTGEQIAELGRALDAAGLTAANEVYPDAPHGFTMADTSSYQEAGAERAFTELRALLDRALKR